MIRHAYYILKLLRIKQWSKNLAIFAAVVFGGQLFNPEGIGTLWNVMFGFIAFCFLSSSSYIINDFLDIEKDRLHPFKKNRPLVSGKVRYGEAIFLFIALLSSSLIIAYFVNLFFLLIAIIYIFLQLIYSYLFKNIVIFDILIIAVGYILRVFAGEAISGYHISVWLLLTTIALSLFLAVCKRRSELTLLRNWRSAKVDAVRASLAHYPINLLDAYATLFATSAFIFYSIFTFQTDPSGTKINIDLLLPEFLPSTLQKKWLMVTIIPVVYGIMRYMHAIYEKNEGESPEKVFLSDKPLLVSVVIWGILVIFIIDVMGL